MPSNNKMPSLKNAFHIESAFLKAVERLKISDFQLSMEDRIFPIEAITHQNVFLPRLALKAEEISVLLFGVRLFESVAYTVNSQVASGFQIQEEDSFTEQQMEDPNFLRTKQIPVADDSLLTAGLRGLLLELAISESFEIDIDNKILKVKQNDMSLHKIFKTTSVYEDGQFIPLLSAEYLSASELQALSRDLEPINALNKARRIAEELANQHSIRNDDAFDNYRGI